MIKPVLLQKLNINYTIPETVGLALTEIAEFKDFIQYYDVGAAMIKPYFEKVHREEIESLSGYYNPDKANIEFDLLLSSDKEPENDAERLTLNLSAILKSAGGTKEEITLQSLQKIQVDLHQGLEHESSGIGLRMETNSLFAAAEEVQTQNPIDKDLRTWLEDLMKAANTKQTSALARCWIFYYYFNIFKPYPAYNELVAYVICKRILSSEKLDMLNTLNLDKYVFRDKEFIEVSKKLTDTEDYFQKLGSDLSEYLEICMKGFRTNIIASRSGATDCVRGQLDYASLTPRQKNSLNFWLEKAFYIHKDKLDELSPRQHEMMLLIAKYGSLSNKDLVPVFQVERKTIQRDFNTLLELKLLDQRGGGRGLRYYINMRVVI